MKKAAAYIFDGLVNLVVQSVRFFIGIFVWVNPVYEVIWVIAAAGFVVFLSFMERGAEKRRGADFRHYLLFSVLPVNVIALTVAAIRGVAEYKIWMSGALIYVYNPLYPIGIAVGTIGITLGFIAVSRLTLRKA